MSATTATRPHGSLRFDPFDPATMRSPFALYAQLRDEAPAHFQRYDEILNSDRARRAANEGFYVLSRFDDVFEAARDTETFSSARGLSLDGGDAEALGLVPTIVMLDPPTHTAYRRLVSRGFTPRVVATLEPEIRAFVEGRLDGLEESLRRDGTADLIKALARPLPSFVVATYLGVPDVDRKQFDRWTDAIVAGNAAENVLGQARDAVAELYAYFAELVERRRREPGDDMITTLVQASLDGEPVSVEQILGYAFVMVAGGNDTTTGLIGGAAALLGNNPDQRRRLVDDPSMIGDAIDEFLRLTSPVQGLSRCVTRAISLHGVDIPAGSRVHLLYGAANRDPREFGPDAEKLDIQRRPGRIMSFTTGPHYCLGASAARLQGRVAIEGLLRRFPDFEVDASNASYAAGAFVRRFTSLPFTPGRR